MECPRFCPSLFCSPCCQCCQKEKGPKQKYKKYSNIEYYQPDVARRKVQMPKNVYRHSKVPVEEIFGSTQKPEEKETPPVTSQPRRSRGDSLQVLDPMYITSRGISHTISQLPDQASDTSRASTPEKQQPTPRSKSGHSSPEGFFITRSRSGTPENYLQTGSLSPSTPEHQAQSTTQMRKSSSMPTTSLVSSSSSAGAPFSPAAIVETEECPKGQKLKLALYHDIQRQTLIVHLQQAVQLPRKKVYKTVGTSITIFLLPSKEDIHHSGVVRGVNPYFNEVFKFDGISSEDIRQQMLVFQLYCHKQLSQETLIGTVVIPLSEVELYGMDIEKEVGEPQDLLKKYVTGDLLLSLTYVSTRHVIQGIILKITNLPKRRKWGLSDPYIKIYLTYLNKRIQKWKSTVKKNTLSPIFNEAFEFDVSGFDKKNLALEIFVMDHEKFRHNDLLGVVYVGSDVPCESGKTHFHDVMTDPGHPVSYWHQLITQEEVKKRKRRKSSTL